jgi:large conductance mechanosensitive channel
MTRKSGLISDFKAFISKGNVVDLAIAVVIAGAFGKVVGSVVTLVMTNALEPALKAANVDSINAWPAGAVIVAIINFLVIAFVCFLIVKSIEASKRKQEVIEEAKPDPQVQLASAITRLTDALERKGF